MSLLISQRLLASSTQMLGVPPPPCDVENVNMANSLKPAPPSPPIFRSNYRRFRGHCAAGIDLFRRLSLVLSKRF
jgi:hypothetical protein